MGGQLNSASSLEVQARKTSDIIWLINDWEVQGGCLSKVGIDWITYSPLANLASWFCLEIQDICSHTAHNKHKHGIAHYQPGGTATLVCKELARYAKQKGDDFRSLGRWCSTLLYMDKNYCLRIVSAYNVGRQVPQGDSTIFQQQLRYIQNHQLSTTPRRLFMIDFLAMLQVWRQQGDRLLIFMDMNEHILNGPLAKCMLQMELEEATHRHWGDIEPHTYVGGKEPIDAVFYTPDLEVTSTLQLSFHKGVGDHRTVLVDISTWSAIGKQDFQVVHPHSRQLNLKNKRARVKYLRHLEAQMATHKMTHRLEECEQAIQSYPSSPDKVKKKEALDKQMAEMQLGSEKQCRPIYAANLPFSEPVRTLHFR
jgi:hypothetical protein